MDNKNSDDYFVWLDRAIKEAGEKIELSIKEAGEKIELSFDER